MPTWKGLWGPPGAASDAAAPTKNLPKRQPCRMHWIFFFMEMYHLYKYSFYLKLPYMGWAMSPCHLGWLIRLTMHFIPMTEPLMDVFNQILLSFSSLALLFILEGFLIAITWEEAVWNWAFFHHLMLLIFPAYDIATGRVAALAPPAFPPHRTNVPSSHAPWQARWRYQLKWLLRTHLISVAGYLFVYVTIVTHVSLITGVNWGWTLFFYGASSGAAIGLNGPAYRLWWSVMFTTLFTIVRLFWVVFDAIWRALGYSPFTNPHQYVVMNKRQMISESIVPSWLPLPGWIAMLMTRMWKKISNQTSSASTSMTAATTTTTTTIKTTTDESVCIHGDVGGDDSNGTTNGKTD